MHFTKSLYIKVNHKKKSSAAPLWVESRTPNTLVFYWVFSGCKYCIVTNGNLYIIYIYIWFSLFNHVFISSYHPELYHTASNNIAGLNLLILIFLFRMKSRSYDRCEQIDILPFILHIYSIKSILHISHQCEYHLWSPTQSVYGVVVKTQSSFPFSFPSIANAWICGSAPVLFSVPFSFFEPTTMVFMSS